MNFTIFFIFFGIFLLACVAVAVYKLWGFIYPFLFWGAIYAPTSKERTEKMIKLLDIKEGDRIIDLGSGDGRLVIEAVKAGAKAYGCEIRPALVKLARKNILDARLDSKAFVFFSNLWNQNLRNFDSVIVYGMRHMMKRLEKKFEKELKPGAKVVSNYFPLPSWTPKSKEDGIYLYIKK